MMVHRSEARAFWFGVTSFVISGVVGILILIANQTETSPWMKIVAGCLSILASVITAISTSGKWSERAAQHHAAAAAYGNVHRRFEQSLALPPVGPEIIQKLLEDLRLELEAIPMSAPPIPESVWKKIPHELTPVVSDGFSYSASSAQPSHEK